MCCVIHLETALTFTALSLLLWRQFFSIVRFTLGLVRGLKAVSIIGLTVNLHLLPLRLPSPLHPLLLRHLILLSTVQGDDILALTLEFLIGLRIDYQFLLDDQIHVHLPILTVQVIGGPPTVQDLIIVVRQVQSGTLPLPYLDQLERLDAC
jgi:hypothetical protein